MADIFLSIVIPAYNEKKNIILTIKEIAEYFRKGNFLGEVIVVDDGSSDNTFAAAEGCRSLFENFKLLRNNRNRGKGFTVKKGILESCGKYVLFMDADSSTSIKELDKFLPLCESGVDICIASRRIGSAKVVMPLKRVLFGRIFIFLTKLLLGIHVNDINCGFKLFKDDIAREIFSKEIMDDWSFDAEILFIAAKKGYSIREVPIEWVYKETSKVRPLRDGINTILSLIKIRQRWYGIDNLADL